MFVFPTQHITMEHIKCSITLFFFFSTSYSFSLLFRYATGNAFGQSENRARNGVHLMTKKPNEREMGLAKKKAE